ncbi:hypothetical protein STEG23_030390, partial [Scotinomys teguina]
HREEKPEDSNISLSKSENARPKSENNDLFTHHGLRSEVNKVINQSFHKKQILMNKNVSESIDEHGSTDHIKDIITDKNMVLLKSLVGKASKKKKTEEEGDHAVNCPQTCFDKENTLPFPIENQFCMNGDNVIDKPLYLSDRFAAASHQEKSHRNENETCNSKFKQVSIYEALKPIPKYSSSGHTSLIGSSILAKDSSEASYLQYVLQSCGKVSPDPKTQEHTKEERILNSGIVDDFGIQLLILFSLWKAPAKGVVKVNTEPVNADQQVAEKGIIIVGPDFLSEDCKISVGPNSL